MPQLLAVAVMALCAIAAGRTVDAATQAAPAPVTLRGRVLDPSNAPIAGARVAARAEVAGPARTATTNVSGRFDLTLPPGPYTIEITARGFGLSSTHLTSGDLSQSIRDFVLQVAPITDTVTVTAPAGYQVPTSTSSTKTSTPLVNVPSSVSVVTTSLIDDQLMDSIADVVRYVPGAMAHQGENNRDEVIVRGNDSSANFYLNGVRDDVQYYRDLYNVDRVEVLKGPNALVFGRGSGGGVVNRVTKEADFGPRREFVLDGGSFGTRRVTTDLDQVVRPGLAVRLNGVFEDSDSFRSHVGLRRDGINPSMTFEPSAATRVTASYEHFSDTRTADRGVPSVNGRPVDVDPSTYFGDPSQSHVHADVDLATVLAQHQIGRLTIRNRVQFGAYDRGYQNFVPGAVDVDSGLVTLTSYNNATRRTSLFNQTDLIYVRRARGMNHTVLAGVEAGREVSNNLRSTGFFNDTTTSIQVPLTSPVISVPMTFRQSATDTDNRVRALTGAAYVQDQVEVTRFLQVLGGIRFDDFDLTVDDHRAGLQLKRQDQLVSPRAGVIVKPTATISAYGSYAVSYLPGSGDQFSSLTSVTEQLQPERFTNYEVGAKWDPRYDLSFTAAVYRLDRTNTRATDPNDPTRIVQTGSQRTNGFETGLNGRMNHAWTIAGGYAFQQSTVTSATAAAALGATVGQVPRHTFSLWNRLDRGTTLGVGLGLVYRSDMFATIDDSVTLPGYVTVDAAFYWQVTPHTRLQANAQNLFNRRYFLNADSNTNISPGAPRGVRVAFAVGF